MNEPVIPEKKSELMCQAPENYCQEASKYVEGGCILSSIHLLRDLKA